MKQLFIFFIFVAGATFLIGCKTTKPAGEKSSIETFTKGSEDINTKLKAFHESKDSTRFFIKINTQDLLYMRNSDDQQQASVIIKIAPIALGEIPLELPAKSIRIIDKDNDSENKVLLGSTLIYLPAGTDYEVNATITDENKQQSYSIKLHCAKSDHRTRSNFIIAQSDLNNPLFTDRIAPNTTYKLRCGKTDKTEIQIRYYKREFPRPFPPFVIYEPTPFDYKADSTFTLPLDSLNQSTFTSQLNGFYHFQSDTGSTAGFSLFISSEEFPAVKSIENMIDPFRYLVGKKDYQKVIDAENPRVELEQYWIEWAGSKDRARKAIAAYYSRIEESNRLFSSFVEGWKSDRGIIYAVYGKPNKVYHHNSIETWIYGEEQNPLSITFNFVQVINPFTDNDYRLIRDEIYKPSWYHSLNACRYGKN